MNKLFFPLLFWQVSLGSNALITNNLVPISNRWRGPGSLCPPLHSSSYSCSAKPHNTFFFCCFLSEKWLLNSRCEAWLTFCGGWMKKGRAESLPSFINKSREKNSCFEFKEMFSLEKWIISWKTYNQMKNVSFFLKFFWINIYPFAIGLSHP